MGSTPMTLLVVAVHEGDARIHAMSKCVASQSKRRGECVQWEHGAA